MSKAVILLSRGLGSATCLAIARDKGYDCYALSFNYQKCLLRMVLIHLSNTLVKCERNIDLCILEKRQFLDKVRKAIRYYAHSLF
ncbi:MAG: hypothetical protein GY750_14695 [Lentisphaerae bacterium]|nr:hypothetical protein [Lentisphaerota bacterium]MCP4102650.1 hypothetical protein [Lentisphaerota bacterium]